MGNDGVGAEISPAESSLLLFGCFSIRARKTLTNCVVDVVQASLLHELLLQIRSQLSCPV